MVNDLAVTATHTATIATKARAAVDVSEGFIPANTNSAIAGKKTVIAINKFRRRRRYSFHDLA